MTTAPPSNRHWFRKLIHGQPHQMIGVAVQWAEKLGGTE